MKVQIKKVDATLRELNFEISKERVSKKMEEVYKDFSKFAKVKGFRKGNVPRKILEAHYEGDVKSEMIKSLVPEVCNEVIEKEKLFILDSPKIRDVSFKNGGLAFIAELEVKPEVTVKDYKGIKIKSNETKISEKEIEQSMQYLKMGRGNEKDTVIDDAFARGLGYPSLEELKKVVAMQLQIDKNNHRRSEVENQIMEDLLRKSKVVAPRSLLKRQHEKTIKEFQERLEDRNFSKEEIRKRQEDASKKLEENIEKEIKLYLIFDKIAEIENIKIEEGEALQVKVLEFLLKEAKWN